MGDVKKTAFNFTIKMKNALNYTIKNIIKSNVQKCIGFHGNNNKHIEFTKAKHIDFHDISIKRINIYD